MFRLLQLLRPAGQGVRQQGRRVLLRGLLCGEVRQEMLLLSEGDPGGGAEVRGGELPPGVLHVQQVWGEAGPGGRPQHQDQARV